MTNKPTSEDLDKLSRDLDQCESDRKRTKDALEKRILALTMPLGDAGDIGFEDLFNLDDIQRLQDEFACATGVGSLITLPDGTPITKPSNFCRLCSDFIRKTEKGIANCQKSDSEIGRWTPGGLNIQPCLSAELWNAGAAISIDGKHIANWLIGQVRDETQNEDNIRRYAREIEVDEEAAIKAFLEVPSMSRDQFERIARMLLTLANQLSATAYQNVQQARFIKEIKKTKEALRESEANLRTLVRTIPDLVWLKDQRGIFLFCNSRFENWFSVNEKDIIGKSDYDFVDTPTADRFRRHDQIVMTTGEPLRIEEEVIFKSDGHSEILETIKTPMYGPDGQLVGVLGIGRNITERKRIEEEKAKIEDQYRQAQKVEAIGRLAGGVAHDLNNLLTPILGYGEMLYNEFGSHDSRKKKLESIIKAGFSARDLVHQLLAFSRKQTLEYKPINMNKAVTGFEKLLRRTIREDVEIRIHLSPNIPTVMADIGQIEQVIMNLAVNASDSMPEGGVLTIETTTVSLDENYAKTHQDVTPGEFVMLSISDTGCGMDKETQKQIFEPFFSTKGKQGTGLGLSTVYGIVKQHKGNIWVYSEAQKGTTFKVYLPVITNGTSEEKTDEITISQMNGTETILIAEDDELVRDISHSVLAHLGYCVLEAASGHEALELISSHGGPINLLLTDVIMPGMNGKELFLKAVDKYPELKVLFMSGYTDNVIANQGVLDKGVHLIQKPFTINALAAKVREILDKK